MSYLVLLALAALDAAGYSVIAPVGPAVAEQTGTGPATIGALVGVFAIGEAGGFWLGQAVVARRGARVALAGSLSLIALGCIGFVAFEGLAAWFPARLIMGLGSGGLWIGLVLATVERFPGREYERLSGVLGAYAVGAIAGPAFGALEGVHGPFAGFLVATLAVLVLLAALEPPRDRATLGSDRRALRTPGFVFASVGILAVAIGYGVIDGPLALRFAERLDQTQIAGLYVGAAVLAGGAALVAGRLRPRPLVPIAALLLLAGIGLTGAVDELAVWLPALALAAIGLGLGETGALGVLLETGPSRIVLAMVVWSQVWALGYLLGPVLAGALAQSLGFGAMGLVPLAGALLVLAATRRSRTPSRSRAAPAR